MNYLRNCSRCKKFSTMLHFVDFNLYKFMYVKCYCDCIASKIKKVK